MQLPFATQQKIHDLNTEGFSGRSIARQLGCAHSTVQETLKRAPPPYDDTLKLMRDVFCGPFGPGLLIPQPSEVVPPAVQPIVVTQSEDLEPWLILGDVHAPYHNRKSWALMMAVARFVNVHGIAMLGDLCDFYSVSSHSKKPRLAHRMKEEVEECNALLDQLDSLGAQTKLFIGGNHEDRLERYLRDKAPELYDLADVPTLLRLKARGWDYTAYKGYTKLGSLHLTHDVGVAGMNATRKALAIFMHSVLTGHTHRLEYIVEGDAVGQPHLAASFGWLGDVEEVDYMARAKAMKEWAQGFGIGHYNAATGTVYVTPVPIINGTCCIEGRMFSA